MPSYGLHPGGSWRVATEGECAKLNLLIVLTFSSSVKIVNIGLYIIVESAGISIDIINEGRGGEYLVTVDLVAGEGYLYRGALGGNVGKIARSGIEDKRRDIVRVFGERGQVHGLREVYP